MKTYLAPVVYVLRATTFPFRMRLLNAPVKYGKGKDQLVLTDSALYVLKTAV